MHLITITWTSLAFLHTYGNYINPVLDQDFPDPVVVRSMDGSFYAYATMGNGFRIQLAHSSDLQQWTHLGEAMSPNSTWGDGLTFWAPDVTLQTIKGKKTYTMYYAGKKPKAEHCIGIALSATPQGPFMDVGIPLICTDSGGPGAIDPKRVDTNEKSYLFWGSGSSIEVTELEPHGYGLLHGTRKTPVLNNSAADYESLIEAAWVDFDSTFPGGGRYWMYYSGNNCCGKDAHYAVSVATNNSTRVAKPYIKKVQVIGSGNSIILEQNDIWQAPGHNCIIRDDVGDAWMFYHAFRGSDRTKRVLLMDKVKYVNGWPLIGTPSSTEQPGPHIKK